MNFNSTEEERAGAAQTKKKTIRWFITGGVTFLVLMVGLILNPLVIVDPGYRGVVVQLGSTQDAVLDDGPHLRVPIRDSIKQIYVGINKTNIEGEAGSSDSQTVDVKATINWHVVPSKAPYVYKELNNDPENTILRPAAIDAMKAATGQYRAEELIGKRDGVISIIRSKLRERILKHGLDVDEVSITNLSFSKAFDQSIEEKTIAEQKKKKAEFDLARIKVEAEQDIARANGIAASMKSKRQEITPEILQQQRLDNELKAIERWDGKLPSVSGGTVPFINLDKVTTGK